MPAAAVEERMKPESHRDGGVLNGYEFGNIAEELHKVVRFKEILP